MGTNKDGTAKPFDAAPGSAAHQAWRSMNPIVRGTVDWESFEMGWDAAMRSVCDRMPNADDAMTPQEVARLLFYVQGANPPNSVVSANSVCSLTPDTARKDKFGP